MPVFAVKAPRALVIEGGGMKGAYANGVLAAFEQQGLHWDAVIGTSAGGALGAWYSARQAEFAQKTWSYAQDRRILDYRRLMRWQPVLDHEALLDIVYVDEHPIDLVALRSCPWPVIVTAADVDTGACVYQDIRQEDVIRWLKATGRLPMAAGPAVEIDGRRYIDGGTVDPIPVRYAVEHLGMRHVTLVLNTPEGPRRPDARFLAELAARKYPRLRHGMLRHQELKQAAMEYARNPPAGVRIDVIRPDGPLGVHRLSRDLAAIDAALERGRRDGQRYVESMHAVA